MLVSDTAIDIDVYIAAVRLIVCVLCFIPSDDGAMCV